MPTVFSHIAVPIVARMGLGKRVVPASMLLVGMLAAIVPDFDGIPRLLGVRFDGLLGHRGFTHSIGFAMAFGLCGLFFARRWGKAPWKAWLWVFACTFSHSLLDACTTGGFGVPLLWPFSSVRFSLPWAFIEISPISLQRFFSGRGAAVFRNELVTVWLPLLSAGMLMGIGRQLGKREK